jgi:hypothetical protein
MKLKTASLIAAIGCTVMLAFVLFMQFRPFGAEEYWRWIGVRVFIYALGWGALINFFFILYKNQK